MAFDLIRLILFIRSNFGFIFTSFVCFVVPSYSTSISATDGRMRVGW